LNSTTRNALEAAAGLCLSRTHYDVEIEHYLIKLLDSSAADLAGNAAEEWSNGGIHAAGQIG
jgi:ATP-dependent Clp protease ATP-binding subunit ClpA